MPQMPRWCWTICMILIQIGRTVPVVVVLAIVLFSYYVYCFHTVPTLTQDWLLRGALYLVFHTLLFMFLLSYFFTIFSPIPKIPENYILPAEVFRDLIEEKTECGRINILQRYASKSGIALLNVSHRGGPRYCMACRCIKPDRSHHCAHCGVCVLRYDHHCPWVRNCIHNNNYKSFLLFLFYGFVICTFTVATSLPAFVMFWEEKALSQELFSKFNVSFLPCVAVLFGIAIACLMFYHIFLVSKNRTTIEQWSPPQFNHGPDPNAYNLGCRSNFKQIFGHSQILWFLPLPTTLTDGLTYPLRGRGGHVDGLVYSNGISSNGLHTSTDESSRSRIVTETV